MKIKRTPAIIGGVVVLGAALLTTYYLRNSSQSSGELGANGVVTPDSVKEGMTTQPVPKVSDKRFEPPPSAGVGSYKEPAPQKNSADEDSAKTNPSN